MFFNAILPQLKNEDELIVVSPDFEMKSILNKYRRIHKNILWIQDKKQGKPIALMMGINKAKGELIVLTDGDVEIGKDSINLLKSCFTDTYVGAVTGQPLSINSRDDMFGLWSLALTNTAHQIRLLKNKNNQYIECSGYLYMIRSGVVDSLIEDALADDSAVSQKIASKGFKIKYEPKAKVFVKYPNNFRDWIAQKVRSTGGYTQKHIIQPKYKTRNFLLESIGFWRVLSYASSLKEFYWLCLLLIARLYVWLLILVKIKILKFDLKKLWPVIDSTK